MPSAQDDLEMGCLLPGSFLPPSSLSLHQIDCERVSSEKHPASHPVVTNARSVGSFHFHAFYGFESKGIEEREKRT